MLVNGRAFLKILFMQNVSSKIRQIDWQIGYATKMSDGLQILKDKSRLKNYAK